MGSTVRLVDLLQPRVRERGVEVAIAGLNRLIRDERSRWTALGGVTLERVAASLHVVPGARRVPELNS